MDHSFWKHASSAGYVTYDADIRHNVMVLKRGNVLRQNILENAVPNQRYQFSFWVKMIGMNALDLKVVFRLRFSNNDLKNGPCNKSVCNLYERPRITTVKADGTGAWQQLITEEFTMFGNWTQWKGETSFILFEMIANMPVGAELRVANFGESRRYVIIFTLHS